MSETTALAAVACEKADREEQLTLAESTAVRGRLAEVKETIDKSYLEMGKLLYQTMHRKLYLDWGYDSFKAYCDGELRFKERKAKYLASIWKTVKVNLGLPDDKVEGIEWTKLQEATKVMDEDNAEDLLEEVRDMTYEQVKNKVREVQAEKAREERLQSGSNDDGDEDVVEKLERFSIQLFEGQKATVEDAIACAERVTGSDKRCHLLATVALEYLSHHLEGDRDARLGTMIDRLERAFNTTLIEVKDKRAALELKKALEAQDG